MSLETQDQDSTRIELAPGDGAVVVSPDGNARAYLPGEGDDASPAALVTGVLMMVLDDPELLAGLTARLVRRAMRAER